MAGVLEGVDVWFGVGEVLMELVVAPSVRVIVCVGLQSLSDIKPKGGVLNCEKRFVGYGHIWACT